MSGPIDPDPRQAGRYQIRLKGHLDDRWATWFDGLNLSRERDGSTTLQGSIPDQAALHGLLQRVRDTGLPLVSVIRLDADSTVRPDNELR
jgi:hypothetical protein